MSLLSTSKRVVTLLVFLVTILSVTAIFVHGPFRREALSGSCYSNQSSNLFILGDVQHVLEGTLTPRVYFDQDASHLAFAIGAGATGSINRTGELMIFSGKAYIKPSDPTTGYRMEASSSVLTPFCFGLEEGAKPTAIYNLENTRKEEHNLSLIYQKLSSNHGRLFAVFGVAEFKEIHCSAVRLAPIYNESITAPGNVNRYFHNLEPIDDRVGVFFGVVNNQKEEAIGYNSMAENKIFYANPAEKASLELGSHTHILISTSKSIEKLPSSHDDQFAFSRELAVVDVCHLLTQSVLRKGALAVYDIGNIVSTTKMGGCELKASCLSSNTPLLQETGSKQVTRVRRDELRNSRMCGLYWENLSRWNNARKDNGQYRDEYSGLDFSLDRDYCRVLGRPRGMRCRATYA